MAGWCGFVLLANLTSLLLARRGLNNHWLNYIVTPVSGALLLWSLSLWQRSALSALALRLAIPLLALTWTGIVLRFENTRTFSLLAEPFAGLLVLGAAIYTLVSRGFADPGNVVRQDWLWVGLGLAFYAGGAIALPPASNWLMQRSPELVVKAYEVKSLVEILALLAIARGLTCPLPPTSPSGGSSWPGSSRWPSSLPVSSLPS